MKKLQVFIIPVLLVVILSCSKTPKERVLTKKDVFPTQKNTDSTFVFSFDTIYGFKDSPEKFKYYEEIASKNQFIRLNNKDLPININLVISCNLPTFCPKYRNTIWLEGDYKEDRTFFEDNQVLTVEIFDDYLQKQLLNWGKNPSYSDNPSKSLIIIKYRNFEKKSKERISNVLDTISKSYFNFIKSFQKQNVDSLKKIYPLQILLEKDFRFFDKNGNIIYPKPPPPTPLEIIE
ncbi:hypothetical protein [uncultured Tenacibaculum sp.]|uniref:hypothetical protein n=1 Tax=uncultured Tenacibaculum sp. TaxID=174713 RepID=UPI00261F95D4|nr:hypothetical protein [uncultured Tenacibaculum sp.]